jgi:KDO2-lipid IV(A) lauroyltransferase
VSDTVGLVARATAGSGTIAQRLRARLIAAGARLLTVLPERPVNAVSDAIGEIWYRTDAARATRARRNFRRVAEGLVARDLGGARIRAAATSDRALERIVRSAFRHFVRSYLDMARLPGQTGADLREKLVIDTPDVVEDAFRVPGPLLFVSLHFGAVEYPALYVAARTGTQVTAPMETLDDPALQTWIVRSRGSVGIEFVTLRDARRALTAALEQGRPVGIVADRNVAGGTIDVPFFGVKAPLPMGPGLLAVEHGLPIWVAAVRRTRDGRYRGQLRRVDVPTEGTRRARLMAAMAGLTRAMEEAVAEAPEQWWAAFSPIWPDLDPEARQGSGRLEPEAAA